MKMESFQPILQIHAAIWEYYEKLYGNKLDNLEETDKVLSTHTLPKLKREEIENLNRPITGEEIRQVIKNLPTNKNPGPDGLRGELTRHLKQR